MRTSHAVVVAHPLKRMAGERKLVARMLLHIVFVPRLYFYPKMFRLSAGCSKRLSQFCFVQVLFIPQSPFRIDNLL